LGDGGSSGAIFDSNKFKMAAAAILDNFEWSFLRNGHRAVIFAIAQLSCLDLNVNISKPVGDTVKMTNRKPHTLSIDTKIDDLELLAKLLCSSNSQGFRRFWSQQQLNEWR